MTRKQVFKIAEPALFVLALCGATLALSKVECRHARNHVQNVNSAKPSTLEGRDFDAHLAACATGDASACHKVETLQQRLLGARDRVAARQHEHLEGVTRGSSTSYAR